mmetsp:Transcript_14124/g.32962  ORF Transcript_14124/g.32962 Transcript_14124/m.32962 type:complete len:380 (-) Transcript_14124:1191-2330(-)
MGESVCPLPSYSTCVKVLTPSAGLCLWSGPMYLYRGAFGISDSSEEPADSLELVECIELAVSGAGEEASGAVRSLEGTVVGGLGSVGTASAAMAWVRGNDSPGGGGCCSRITAAKAATSIGMLNAASYSLSRSSRQARAAIPDVDKIWRRASGVHGLPPVSSTPTMPLGSKSSSLEPAATMGVGFLMLYLASMSRSNRLARCPSSLTICVGMKTRSGGSMESARATISSPSRAKDTSHCRWARARDSTLQLSESSSAMRTLSPFQLAESPTASWAGGTGWAHSGGAVSGDVRTRTSANACNKASAEKGASSPCWSSPREIRRKEIGMLSPKASRTLSSVAWSVTTMHTVRAPAVAKAIVRARIGISSGKTTAWQPTCSR